MGVSKLKPQINRLVTTEGLSDREILLLARSDDASHIIQNDGWKFEDELRIAHEMIREPKTFLRHPLRQLLQAEDLLAGRQFSYRCAAHEKKGRMLERFETFLEASASTRRRSDVARLIMDELYTNASRNARAIVAKPSKGLGVGIVEAFAFANSEQLILGCRDSFGRLEIPALIERLETCLVNGVAESIRHDTEGAGIGSFLVFDACDSYFAAVHETKATVVGGRIVLDSGPTSRSDGKSRSKHIHLIRINE